MALEIWCFMNCQALVEASPEKNDVTKDRLLECFSFVSFFF